MADLTIPRHRAGGSTVLPISVLLLFLSTLILIAVSKVTLTDQRLSGNEIRTRQALQAAQAGIAHAVAYMNNGGVDHDGDEAADTLLMTNPLPNGASGAVVYCDPDTPVPENACAATTPACGAALTDSSKFNIPLLLACGRSDDGLAVQAVVVKTSGAPGANPLNIVSPLISGGSVTLSGSASVANYYSDEIIISKNQYEALSNAGKIYLRNDVAHPTPTTMPPPPTQQNICNAPCDPDETVPYMSLGENQQQIMAIGLDESLGDDAMFEKYFCMNLQDYKTNVAYPYDPPLTAGQLDGMKGKAVVFEGDLALSGGVIGTQQQPMVIVVDGNLTLNGSPEIHGVVYVTGSITKGTGVATIYGSIIAQQNLDFGAGNLTIVYDKQAITNAAKIGRPGITSGSWRDWL